MQVARFHNPEINGHYAAKLAMFLQENTGSVCGKWRGRMSAQEQRELFGLFLGKGWLCIDGATERIRHTRKVCFGTDFDTNHDLAWRELH